MIYRIKLRSSYGCKIHSQGKTNAELLYRRTELGNCLVHVVDKTGMRPIQITNRVRENNVQS